MRGGLLDDYEPRGRNDGAGGSRYEHGRVLAVNETNLGSDLVGDLAAGATELQVDDAVDFDEDGGWLSINGQVVKYTAVDDDTGTITIAEPLEALAEEGDEVLLWDDLRGVVTTDKVAQVELDGDDDNVDPLEATIPLHLLDDLDEGIRGTTGESVLLELDGDEWRIVDVLGLAATGASGVNFYQDGHTVSATGDQAIALTHTPLANSEHVYWEGLYQPASEWTRQGKTVTVADPTLAAKVGDVFTVEYAYGVVGKAVPSGEDAKLSVPLGATWKLKFFASDTPSTTYAQPGYDDSGWQQGATPIATGYPGELHSTNGYVWLRKAVTTYGGDLLFKEIGPDDRGRYYLDGVLVTSWDWPGDWQERTFLKTGVAAGEHTLAAYVWNVGSGGYKTSVQVYEQ